VAQKEVALYAEFATPETVEQHLNNLPWSGWHVNRDDSNLLHNPKVLKIIVVVVSDDQIPQYARQIEKILRPDRITHNFQQLYP